MKLSVVINSKNSAKTLERTLKSAFDLADELVVVDMESTDSSLEIAKKYKAKIYKHKDVGYVEPARNFAISKASGDWIFVLDSDEELTSELRRVIRLIVNDEIGEALKADCYYVPRKNIIFEKWIQHTGWWPDYQLRLFKKGYVKWLDEIHSFPITRGIVKQFPGKEELAIVHHEYQSVEQFISRLNRYTSIKAESLNKAKLGSNKQPFKVFGDEFLSRLFARRGIEDGVHGISLSLLQAMYEAVVQIKVIFDQKQDGHLSSRETILSLRKFQRDLDYWIADYEVSHSKGFKKLIWKLRRKFSF